MCWICTRRRGAWAWSQGYVLAAARLQQYLVPLLVAPKQDLDAAVVCSDRVHNLKHSEPNRLANGVTKQTPGSKGPRNKGNQNQNQK